MMSFSRLILTVLTVLWASVAASSNVEENLRSLFTAHEAAIEGASNLSMRRLANGSDADNAADIYTKDYLATVPFKEGGEQWRCLSEALYFEARGEAVEGQFAVAEVILNRVDSPRFPDSICGVVLQGSGQGKFRCQFTYTCDGKLETINNQTAWQNVGKVASLSIAMDRRPLTFGATYYHTNYVSPSWSKKFARTASIGVHYFYKEPDRISSN